MTQSEFDERMQKYMALDKRVLAELLAARDHMDGCNGQNQAYPFNEPCEKQQRWFDTNRMFLVYPENLPYYGTTYTTSNPNDLSVFSTTPSWKVN